MLGIYVYRFIKDELQNTLLSIPAVFGPVFSSSSDRLLLSEKITTSACMMEHVARNWSWR